MVSQINLFSVINGTIPLNRKTFCMLRTAKEGMKCFCGGQLLTAYSIQEVSS
jgi:hypothetical protein